MMIFILYDNYEIKILSEETLSVVSLLNSKYVIDTKILEAIITVLSDDLVKCYSIVESLMKGDE